MITEAYDDFGFSTISEADLKHHEFMAREEANDAKSKLASFEKQDGPNRQKLKAMYSLIMPLLKNLKANPQNEIIKWPNREAKINEFIAKLDQLME